MSLRERLACIQNNMGTQNVTLVAVSKYASVPQMVSAYEAGIRHFGENKVQDALRKKADLPPEMVKNTHWHLIGHLQTNKVKKTIGQFKLIHSLDRVALAETLSECNLEAGRIQPVLLQVNLTQEATKHGFLVEELKACLHPLSMLPGIRLKGLMTMARAGAQASELHNTFCGLRDLRNQLERLYSIELPELSMGMSQDYVQAIACGATIIRVGNYLFHESEMDTKDRC